ncbi:succinic semialdehyde dehydrogenase [Nocardia sp. BMG51109]|uniref:succinic semialdehyde dehydrogenase n=1 Tax=Nocardia sp. BMG51109 TaxID=1056816 RepID=UPI0004668B6B|nr:succinic semialdehyde dehydrogenase [Nocardia sp. BMG51109]
MPVPQRQTLDRLRDLAALGDPAGRPQRRIDEVFTGDPLAEIPMGDAEDVTAAFAEARAAQGRWAETSPRERAAVFERYRTLILDNRDFLMDLLQAETGKSRAAANEEVLGLALATQYYARVASGLLRPYRVPGLFPILVHTVVYHQPKGVVGFISPWNYPMILSIGDAVPALLAGNAAVIKPDSRTPFSLLANAELLYRAGLPRDVLAVVPGEGTVVGAEIAGNCDYLMFTGSTATGRLLAEQCARRLIGFSAELGGKNPMIVAAGADLDTVARAALRACFGNAGQLCLSMERIYVEAAVAQEFTEKFVAATESMTVGGAYDFTVAMGSMISADQLERVAKHVADAKSKGAKVLTGGNPRPDLGPLFYEPTVLTGVTDEMECARQETFGPLVAIYPVDTVDEAVARANDSEYGLNASVWAGSKARGRQIARRLRTGTVNVDEGYVPAFGSMGAPMGGMRDSGLGRRNGVEGLLKYTEPQAVATTRFKNLDTPPFLTDGQWQRLMIQLAGLVGLLPGRDVPPRTRRL